MSTIIGREREKKIFEQILEAKNAQFVAVYGRRRVGKTHLIREFFSPLADVYFSITGIKNGSLTEQLFTFQQELEKVFYEGRPIPKLRSWREAFETLSACVEQKAKDPSIKNIIIFLDELPWLSSKKSKLLQAIDHYWNTRLSLISPLRLIVCGSAASWIINQLIHAKGGLHNRLTQTLRLAPFNLKETRDFLKTECGASFNFIQVLEIYMALGGIPYYLKNIKSGYSAAQNIGKICFEEGAYLSGEFDKLFSALFDHAEVYEKIVRALASKKEGMSRNDLIKKTKLSSGGGLASKLRELEESGFIASFNPYKKKVKDVYYRIIDEYIIFYLKWIDKSPKRMFAGDGEKYWQENARTPSFRSWAGYAFEGICLKHYRQIQVALGLNNIACDTATWRYIPPPRSAHEQGAQIDLLFDRSDGIIHICEIKYSAEPFTVDRSFAQELKQKISVFETKIKLKKQIFVALIAPYGFEKTSWSKELITNCVTAEDLFK